MNLVFLVLSYTRKENAPRLHCLTQDTEQAIIVYNKIREMNPDEFVELIKVSDTFVDNNGFCFFSVPRSANNIEVVATTGSR